MPDFRFPKKLLFGELQHGKRYCGGQRKQLKDILKISLKSFKINPLSWEHAASEGPNGEPLSAAVPTNMNHTELMLNGAGGTRNKGLWDLWHLLPSPVPTATEPSMHVFGLSAISAPIDDDTPLSFKHDDRMVLVVLTDKRNVHFELFRLRITSYVFIDLISLFHFGFFIQPCVMSGLYCPFILSLIPVIYLIVLNSS